MVISWVLVKTVVETALPRRARWRLGAGACTEQTVYDCKAAFVASCDENCRTGGCDESHVPPPPEPGTAGPPHLTLRCCRRLTSICIDEPCIEAYPLRDLEQQEVFGWGVPAGPSGTGWQRPAPLPAGRQQHPSLSFLGAPAASAAASESKLCP